MVALGGILAASNLEVAPHLQFIKQQNQPSTVSFDFYEHGKAIGDGRLPRHDCSVLEELTDTFIHRSEGGLRHGHFGFTDHQSQLRRPSTPQHVYDTETGFPIHSNKVSCGIGFR
jgi:hypothetical protein